MLLKTQVVNPCPHLVTITTIRFHRLKDNLQQPFESSFITPGHRLIVSFAPPNPVAFVENHTALWSPNMIFPSHFINVSRYTSLCIIALGETEIRFERSH